MKIIGFLDYAVEQMMDDSSSQFEDTVPVMYHQISCFLLVDPLCLLINLVNLSIPPFKRINTFDKPPTVVEIIKTPIPYIARIGEIVQITRELRLPFLQGLPLP